MKTLIVKEVSKKNILTNINIEIEQQEIVALVGPNGSGKSTLMKCIMGFSKIDHGQININNNTISDKDYLKNVVCSIEHPSLYPDLTGNDHFRFIARLNKVDDSSIQYYKNFTNLKDKLDKKTKQYSVGMKQILFLSLLMMQDPCFLILDEPFNGLDLQTKTRVMEELKKLNNQKTTILWSSHEINQLRELSDRFIFINNGFIVGHMNNEQNYQNKPKTDKIEQYYLEVCGNEKLHTL